MLMRPRPRAARTPYSVFTSMEWMDAFTVLALLIPVTKTVRLGTSVTIVPYRHPLEMARVVASLDVASGGRMIFGAGVGWMADEFELLGVPYKERAPRTREYIAVMKEVWTNETPRFDGKFVQINRGPAFCAQADPEAASAHLGWGANPLRR